MNTAALKLVVTPVLILAASRASRRWGEAVGGWLVGLPLTSGPVCFFLALDQGVGFAAATGLGSMAGAGAEAAFCLGYAWTARVAGWPAALAAGSTAFIGAVVAFNLAALPLLPLVVGVCALLAGTLRLLPRLADGASARPAVPRWDLPARIVIATGIVLTVTELAPRFGPRLSGLLAAYPVFAAVLTAFSHRARGPAAAVQVLRGLLTGLFAFTGFFAVLALGLERLGVAAGFAAATVAALAIQTASLRRVRR